MHKYRLLLIPAMFLSAVILTLNGCGWKSGPSRVAIDGVVLVSDAPLKDGRISFIPMEETTGPAAVARVVAGKFRFNSRTGPVVGKHKVQIDNAATLALFRYTPHTVDTGLKVVGGGNYRFRKVLEEFTQPLKD